MRNSLAAIFLALCLLTTGCGGVKSVESSFAQQVEQLRAENASLRHDAESKPRSIVKTVEVTKVIEDTSRMMAWFKFVGASVFALGFGAFCASFAWPFVGMVLKGAGTFAMGTGGAMFALGLGTQISLPWLPYFLFTALCIGAVGFAVWIIRKVDWSPAEAKAVSDLARGVAGADQHPLIKELIARAANVK